MLKPLPFPDPERLVEVCTPYQREMLRWVDYPDYLDMAVGQHTFETISAIAVPQTLDLGGAGRAAQSPASFVSPSLPKVSGLPMELGRWLPLEEHLTHVP